MGAPQRPAQEKDGHREAQPCRREMGCRQEEERTEGKSRVGSPWPSQGLDKLLPYPTHSPATGTLYPDIIYFVLSPFS